MNKSIPNLFVVGAAKAGTSSLHKYLNTHQQISMSSIKEPHYMLRKYFDNKNFKGPGDNKIISSYITKLSDYQNLFKGNYINGETSPGYFSLEEIAIPEIKKNSKNPYIIICLRNPIHRTYSAYMHKCRDGHENKSLEEILRENLETKRLKENWAWGWYYLKDSFYYDKVKEFKLHFKNVKVIFFEDLITEPDMVLQDLALFLNIDSFQTPVSQVQNNKTGLPRYPFIRRIIQKFHPHFSDMLSETTKNSIRNAFIKKPELHFDTEEKLKRIFFEDIVALGQLLEIDLIKKWKIK